MDHHSSSARCCCCGHFSLTLLISYTSYLSEELCSVFSLAWFHMNFVFFDENLYSYLGVKVSNFLFVGFFSSSGYCYFGLLQFLILRFFFIWNYWSWVVGAEHHSLHISSVHWFVIQIIGFLMFPLVCFRLGLPWHVVDSMKFDLSVSDYASRVLYRLVLVLVACLVPSMLSTQVISYDGLVVFNYLSFLQLRSLSLFGLSGIPYLQNRFPGSKRLSFLVGVRILSLSLAF